MSIWKRLADLARANATPLEPHDDPLADLDPLLDTAVPAPESFTAEQRRCYRVLGLDPGAGRTEIRSAYRRALLRYPPDRFAADPEKLEAATEITRRLTEAYDALMGDHGD